MARITLSHLDKRYPNGFIASRDLCLEIADGELLVLVGPSGSGKSTVLRMIAGLERPDSGAILVEGRDVSGVEPWHRNLGMMFQQYALFPHMTVAENIGYGLKVRGMSERDRDAQVARMLDLVGLAGMERRNATLLSGGEQQRVALARALAPAPRLLLLDEPLSALDEQIRRTMQRELKEVHRRTGTTFLYVTHDQEEALTMSDRIAVLNRGHCVQCDTPERLHRHPRTRFVAGFFRGCNVLAAASVPGKAALQLAGHEIALANGSEAGTRSIAIRAENLHVTPPFPADALTFAAGLTEVTYRGTVLDYALTLADGQSITVTTTQRIAAEPGARVTIGVSRDDLVLLED